MIPCHDIIFVFDNNAIDSYIQVFLLDLLPLDIVQVTVFVWKNVKRYQAIKFYRVYQQRS